MPPLLDFLPGFVFVCRFLADEFGVELARAEPNFDYLVPFSSRL